MEGRALDRLPGQADPGAELVGVDILPHLVEAQAGIERQLVGDLPFVGDVGGEQISGLGVGIEHGEWCVDRVAGIVERQHGRTIIDQRALGAERHAELQRVREAQPVGRVFLDSVDKALTIHVRSYPVEQEIADRIRREVQLAVAVEIGDLVVEAVARLLIGHDVELVELALPLVEQRGIEVGDAVGGEGRRLAGIVRDLVVAVGDAADIGQPAGRIDRRRDIGKAFLLIGAVVDRVIGRRRVLDADIAAEIAARDVVLGLSDRAAIVDAGGEVAMLPP